MSSRRMEIVLKVGMTSWDVSWVSLLSLFHATYVYLSFIATILPSAFVTALNDPIVCCSSDANWMSVNGCCCWSTGRRSTFNLFYFAFILNSLSTSIFDVVNSFWANARTASTVVSRTWSVKLNFLWHVFRLLHLWLPLLQLTIWSLL